MHLKQLLALLYTVFVIYGVQLSAAQQAEVKQNVARQQVKTTMLKVVLPNGSVDEIALQEQINFSELQSVKDLVQQNAEYNTQAEKTKQPQRELIIARAYTRDDQEHGYAHYFDAQYLEDQLSAGMENSRLDPLNRLSITDKNTYYVVYLPAKSWIDRLYGRPQLRYLCSREDLLDKGRLGAKWRQFFQKNGYTLRTVPQDCLPDYTTPYQSVAHDFTRHATPRNLGGDFAKYFLGGVVLLPFAVALIHGVVNNWLARRAGSGITNWDFWDFISAKSTDAPLREIGTGAFFYSLHLLFCIKNAEVVQRRFSPVVLWQMQEIVKSIAMISYWGSAYFGQCLGEVVPLRRGDSWRDDVFPLSILPLVVAFLPFFSVFFTPTETPAQHLSEANNDFYSKA